ncbi:MAG TPA: hypothetical protein VLZ74_07550 [Methylocella sp.]|nr:hypothetical protein [Methylocella sp.]
MDWSDARLGAALRRLPLAGEVVVRALVMTAALIVVGFSLQFPLYALPFQLRSVSGAQRGLRTEFRPFSCADI